MSRKLKVLVACEYSGRVRDAFYALGHDATSCDFHESETPGQHIKGDVRDALDAGWDLMIAHPDCTYLCSSGLHWNKRVKGRAEKTEAALGFVQELMDAPIHRIAIENPVGCIGTRIKKASQYIQPYEYGHDASKRTGLWLKNLPVLVPDPKMYISPRLVNGKPRWRNQGDSGQSNHPENDERWRNRSRTYQGWAQAMAWQWGGRV